MHYIFEAEQLLVQFRHFHLECVKNLVFFLDGCFVLPSLRIIKHLLDFYWVYSIQAAMDQRVEVLGVQLKRKVENHQPLHQSKCQNSVFIELFE